jgi:predicted transcriptional regulator of viral defense system
MKYYEQLAKMGCFTRNDVCTLIGNYDTGGTLLKNYQKKGYVQHVRRNLYVAINLADLKPVVSKFRIAQKITPTAYLSHRTAFEYYGYPIQESHQVNVSSVTPFVPFIFDGYNFAYIASRTQDGVTTKHNGIRITDIERTVLDSINDYEKVIGLGELLRCLEMVAYLCEDTLLVYLATYGKQAMYQKTGYILQHFQRKLHLSNSFFKECAAHVGKSTRYLTWNGKGIYNQQWKLMAPPNLMEITRKGINQNANI